MMTAPLLMTSLNSAVEVTLCTPVAVDRPAAAILTADVLRGRGVVVIAGTNCAVRIESSVLGANRGI